MHCVISNIVKILLIGILLVAYASSRPSTLDNPPQVSGSGEDKLDPSEYYGNLSIETIRQIRKCDLDPSLMEHCMRCAKRTKSSIVYPLCCDNEDGTTQWCHDYMSFGSQD